MSFPESIIVSIGELAAYLLGLAIERSFDLDPKEAEAVGIYLVLGVFVAALITVTVIYS